MTAQPLTASAPRTIVISQPMFFPWVGLFEQVRLADVYVHYDDVQLPQGRSFMNRVQIKTPQGSQWLTLPIQRQGKQLINEVQVDDAQNWRKKHFGQLERSYTKAPYVKEMLDIVDSVYQLQTTYLAALNIHAIERIAAYFDLQSRFQISSKMHAKGQSSERLVDLIKNVDGRIYITGHGARNYIDYDLFERNQLRIEYMTYNRTPYPQLHGVFDPHVSILDLIANVGRAGLDYIHSGAVYWKDLT